MSSPDIAAAGAPVVPRGPVAVLDTREQYLDAVHRIAAGDGPVAVDAERASGFRYSQRAYLIQVYRRGAGTFLFDPPPIGSFGELHEVLRDVEWVLHAASQDLACLREVGLYPARIFDTELAARLLGLPKVGLGSVVQELLGLHLAKEHSAADWSTRPLPQTWLVYAALDVELLIDLRDLMTELIAEQGKTAIAAQEFEAVLNREVKAVRAEPWRRLSGVHAVRGGRNLAVARALWEARDEYARQVDTSPGRLIPDSSLVAVARNLPATKKDLAAMREFTGRASRSQIDRWWGAIEAGLASDDLPNLRGTGEAIPPPRSWPERNPDADKRLKTARPAITEVAERLNLPLENLLTPEFLRRLAWQPPEPLTAENVAATLEELGARAWQIDATAQVIVDAFVGAAQTPEDRMEPAS